MDDIVRQAMAKWPSVPHCYGWLALDARGAFRMRDEAAQAAHAPGDVIRHPALLSFIYRNYLCDERGCWYFQNGPQRVYVELESAPFIYRLDEHFMPSAHTGQTTTVLACLVDEAGRVYLHTPLGLGLVHTLDVGLVAQAIEQGLWTPEDCEASALALRYGFVLSPQSLFERA